MTRERSAGGAHPPSDEELQQQLDALGQREASALSHPDETRGPGDTEAFVLKEILGETDATELARPSSGRWIRWAAVVVLGALASFLVWDSSSDVPQPVDVLLGVSDVQLIEPLDNVTAWADFRFDVEVPDGAYAVVVVLPEGAEEPVRSIPLDGTVWTPESHVSQDWERIEWWVEVVTGLNQPKVVGQSSVVAVERR